MHRYNYNVKRGLLGLTLGVLVLVAGILIGYGQAAAALSMSVLLISIPAAYSRVRDE
jgi:hypothetical protein